MKNNQVFDTLNTQNYFSKGGPSRLSQEDQQSYQKYLNKTVSDDEGQHQSYNKMIDDQYNQQPHSMYEDVEPLGRVMRLNNHGRFNFQQLSSSSNSKKMSKDEISNRSQYQQQPVPLPMVKVNLAQLQLERSRQSEKSQQNESNGQYPEKMQNLNTPPDFQAINYPDS